MGDFLDRKPVLKRSKNGFDSAAAFFGSEQRNRGSVLQLEMTSVEPLLCICVVLPDALSKYPDKVDPLVRHSCSRATRLSRLHFPVHGVPLFYSKTSRSRALICLSNALWI